MTNFASRAERKAAPILAAHPAPSKPCQSFAAVGLSKFYLDAANQTCEGKPDFLCQQALSFTLEELKDGDLNFHRTHESSRAALQSEYTEMTGRFTFEDLPHSMLSKALYDAGRTRACLDHGFNHSLYKVLALQAAHGWQRYVVVFVKTPPKRYAMQYIAAGLVFCTLKTLPDMLRTIELCQHGFFVPFQFISNRAKYWYTVTPDHTDHGKSAEVVTASDRAKFLAVANAPAYVPPYQRSEA
jgi:hypothetical protein